MENTLKIKRPKFQSRIPIAKERLRETVREKLEQIVNEQKLQVKQVKKTDLEKSSNSDQIKYCVVQPDRVKPEKVKPENAKIEQVKPEKKQTEKAKPGKPTPEMTQLEKVKLEKAKYEKAKLDKIKYERKQLEKLKLEKIKLGDIKSEMAKLAKEKLEMAKTQKAKPEKVKPEQLKPNQLKSEKGNAENEELVKQEKPIQVKFVEQSEPAQLKYELKEPEKRKSEQVMQQHKKPEQINPEQVKPEQIQPDPEKVKQLKLEQDKTKLTQNEQVKEEKDENEKNGETKHQTTDKIVSYLNPKFVESRSDNCPFHYVSMEEEEEEEEYEDEDSSDESRSSGFYKTPRNVSFKPRKQSLSPDDYGESNKKIVTICDANRPKRTRHVSRLEQFLRAQMVETAHRKRKGFRSSRAVPTYSTAMAIYDDTPDLRYSVDNPIFRKMVSKSNLPELKIMQEESIEMMSLRQIGCVPEISSYWSDFQQPIKKNLYQLIKKMAVQHMKPDIQVAIANVFFNCHLLVLQCYSEYFMKVPCQPSISIPGDRVTPAAFSLVYEWMLQDTPQLKREKLLEVLNAACFLGIRNLVRQCWFCLDNVDIFNEDTAFMLFLESNGLNVPFLEDIMLRRVTKFFLTMVSSQDFLEMSIPNLVSLLRSNRIGVNTEVEVLMSVVRWLNYKWDLRQTHVPLLMQCIRFSLIPTSYLLSLKHLSLFDDFNRVIEHSEVQRVLNEAFFANTLLHYGGNSLPFMAVFEQFEIEKPSKRIWVFDKNCPYHQPNREQDNQEINYGLFMDYLSHLQCVAYTHWKFILCDDRGVD